MMLRLLLSVVLGSVQAWAAKSLCVQSVDFF